MGGHGGLNILPQKKWNVYNWDNRIKVSKDEAKVNRELKKKHKNLKHKRFTDKILKIKRKESNDDVRSVQSDEENRKYKNQIFNQIQREEKLEKKMKVTEYFDKMRTIVNKDEHIKLFECEEKIEKEKKAKEEIEEEITKDVTFKDSISKHLSPWYMKKRLEDYKEVPKSTSKGKLLIEKQQDDSFYQTVKEQFQKAEERFLNRKKEKKSKKQKKHHKRERSSSGSSDKETKNERVSIEALRRERFEREEKERKRIQLLLQGNKN